MFSGVLLKDNFLFSGIFLFALSPDNRVEKFELIATTGKNAKTAFDPVISINQLYILFLNKKN
jgi:hypothetical protein